MDPYGLSGYPGANPGYGVGPPQIQQQYQGPGPGVGIGYGAPPQRPAGPYDFPQQQYNSAAPESISSVAPTVGSSNSTQRKPRARKVSVMATMKRGKDVIVETIRSRFRYRDFHWPPPSVFLGNFFCTNGYYRRSFKHYHGSKTNDEPTPSVDELFDIPKPTTRPSQVHPDLNANLPPQEPNFFPSQTPGYSSNLGGGPRNQFPNFADSTTTDMISSSTASTAIGGFVIPPPPDPTMNAPHFVIPFMDTYPPPGKSFSYPSGPGPIMSDIEDPQLQTQIQQQKLAVDALKTTLGPAAEDAELQILFQALDNPEVLGDNPELLKVIAKSAENNPALANDDTLMKLLQTILKQQENIAKKLNPSGNANDTNPMTLALIEMLKNQNDRAKEGAQILIEHTRRRNKSRHYKDRRKSRSRHRHRHHHHRSGRSREKRGSKGRSRHKHEDSKSKSHGRGRSEHGHGSSRRKGDDDKERDKDKGKSSRKHKRGSKDKDDKKGHKGKSKKDSE